MPTMDTSRRRQWKLADDAVEEIVAAKEIDREDLPKCHLVLVVKISGAAGVGDDPKAFRKRIISVEPKCEGPCDPPGGVADCELKESKSGDGKKHVSCECAKGSGEKCTAYLVVKGDKNIEGLACSPVVCATFGETCKRGRTIGSVDRDGNRTVRVFCKCLA